MSYTKKDVLTIPNILSVIRLLMIPVFAMLYIKAETAKDYIVSAAVLTGSVLTDMLDGIIARKCHMVSKLGIMLDPFADKVTQGIVMICLSIRHSEIIPLFMALKEQDIKIGLITNCYFEERDVIKNSVFFDYFDSVCMSC